MMRQLLYLRPGGAMRLRCSQQSEKPYVTLSGLF